MRIARRGWIAIPAAVALAVGLAGCSAGGSSGSSDVPKNVVIAYPSQHSSFDPTKTVVALDGAVFSQIGGKLTSLTMGGKVENELAQSIQLSPDYTSATVVLKSGLKFSDGSPLTAKDVAATFTRDMAVKGSTINSLTGNFKSVTAESDTKVLFDFVAPFPSFADAMSNDSALVFPASGLAKGASFFSHPISAGAYELDGGWSNNQVKLVRNPHFVGGTAVYPSVSITSLSDPNAVVSQLKSGQIQFAADLPPNYLSQFSGTDVKTAEIPGWGFYDLRLNNTVAPLNNVDVRNAINDAIDRNALVQQIFQGNDKVLGGFWPDTLQGYDPSYTTPRNLTAAKALLKGTPCENGCTIQLMYSVQDFAFADQLALMLQSQLKQIGITVTLDSTDQATEVSRLLAGQYQMAPGANNSDGAYPDKLINDALLSTGGIKAELTGYSSPEMDALVRKVDQNQGSVRREAEAQIEALFAKDRPYITWAMRVRPQASSLPSSDIHLIGTSLGIATDK